MVNNFEEEHPIAWYLTDDRDKPIEDQIGLFITTGGNGDWYIGTSPASNPNATLQAVRLCTSGGAVTLAPGLTWAIADAFKAIQAANEKKQYVRTSNHEDECELKAWRRRFPELEFDGSVGIREKTSDNQPMSLDETLEEWYDELERLVTTNLKKPATNTDPTTIHPSRMDGLAKNNNSDLETHNPTGGIRVFKTLRKVLNYVKGQ